MRDKGLLLLIGGVLFGVLLGSLVLFSGTNSSAPGNHRNLPPTVGSPAKDFQLVTIDSTTIALKEYFGQPVVVSFWATWCQPCKEEMPLLERYSQKYSDQLTILGINSGELFNTVQSYIYDQGITFIILLDIDGAVSSQYHVRSFPVTFFIDKEGVLRAQHIGVLSETLMDEYLALIGVDL